jgi:hypothetical protein
MIFNLGINEIDYFFFDFDFNGICHKNFFWQAFFKKKFNILRFFKKKSIFLLFIIRFLYYFFFLYWESTLDIIKKNYINFFLFLFLFLF